MPSIDQLNEQFALNGHLSFEPGPGNLPMAHINNKLATGLVSLYGGQALKFQPHDQPPVLWLSDHAHYQPGKAIRGGIPIAWPWFGPHPATPTSPAHGFARIQPWTVTATQAIDDATQIRLKLEPTPLSRDLWPHEFELEAWLTFGQALSVELVARNTDSTTFSFGSALHSYFSVSNIHNIQIHGLDNVRYLDKVYNNHFLTQRGPITVATEIDRIYLDTTATCVIEDPGWHRRINIEKAGSHSTVVWNPWLDKAKALKDFGDEEYLGMVCVETTNAADDIIIVPPGSEHHLKATIHTQPIQD